MPAERRPWSREELLLALNLYFQISFGRQHQGASEVMALAAAIDRTPSAVAMKLNNFTALDPDEQARGVKGLQGASQADRALWLELHQHWETVTAESERLWSLTGLGEPPRRAEPQVAEPAGAGYQGPTEAWRPVNVRLAQDFFRKVVGASYGHRCCISGIAVPGLLIASHIVPWAEDAANRARPSNGLLLSSLHDAAFDRNLVTFDERLRLLVSKRLHDHFTNQVVRAAFAPFEGQPLRLPERHAPDPRLLARHRARFAAVA